MTHDEFNFWRKIRIKLFGAIAFFFFAYALYLHRGYRVPWGYRMFFVGVIGFFFSLFIFERRNLRALAEEEEKCRQDPKHFFRNDTALAFHPDIKNWLSFFLVFTGLGMLVLTFEKAGHFPLVFHIGLLFWGTSLIIAGVLLQFFIG